MILLTISLSLTLGGCEEQKDDIEVLDQKEENEEVLPMKDLIGTWNTIRVNHISEGTKFDISDEDPCDGVGEVLDLYDGVMKHYSKINITLDISMYDGYENYFHWSFSDNCTGSDGNTYTITNDETDNLTTFYKNGSFSIGNVKDDILNVSINTEKSVKDTIFLYAEWFYNVPTNPGKVGYVLVRE